ncbi:bifunctional DNA primase/polymerase [Bailinhaonella thermotolerans]|uniref:DNA primase n=1 Tax=Bailinhaonella thermotolerans TaxID=1070861 RepID=A0A3A4A2P5_9ACTN|nr:bifunctional DNA primase/polymerase [Bailinhaonella thermotolerans]RJL22610.1 DNA primase [Bailinhaonella thermotolerans]
MVGVPIARRSKRRIRPAAKSAVISDVLAYAELGWASCPGAYPLREGARACSCDRVGCPDPGAHPISPAWAAQATVDPALIAHWWGANPQAGVILPTGRVFDVFDVPTAAGVAALARIEAEGHPVGPVAAYGADRILFWVNTRGAPDDEDEWWSCHLDCHPDTIDETPGLRWHCRDSYVLAPPSALASGGQASWLHEPDGRPLPDPLRMLDVLADVCGEETE